MWWNFPSLPSYSDSELYTSRLSEKVDSNKENIHPEDLILLEPSKTRDHAELEASKSEMSQKHFSQVITNSRGSQTSITSCSPQIAKINSSLSINQHETAKNCDKSPVMRGLKDVVDGILMNHEVELSLRRSSRLSASYLNESKRESFNKSTIASNGHSSILDEFLVDLAERCSVILLHLPTSIPHIPLSVVEELKLEALVSLHSSIPAMRASLISDPLLPLPCPITIQSTHHPKPDPITHHSKPPHTHTHDAHHRIRHIHTHIRDELDKTAYVRGQALARRFEHAAVRRFDGKLTEYCECHSSHGVCVDMCIGRVEDRSRSLFDQMAEVDRLIDDISKL